MSSSNKATSSRSRVIEAFHGIEGKDLKADKLFVRRGESYVPIASIYPKGTRKFIGYLRAIIRGPEFYRAQQEREAEMISSLGHHVAISVYAVMKSRAGYQNRVKEFNLTKVAKILKVSYPTLTKGINVLEAYGAIRRVGNQVDRAYYINPEFFSKGKVELMIETIKLFSSINKSEKEEDAFELIPE